MNTYIDVTPEAGKEFFTKQHKGEIVMLNLLKYKKIADYSDIESLSPGKEITGNEAYQLYIEHTLPILKKAGSTVLFYGKGDAFLIGPENQKWDAVLLVKHKSVSKFMEFAQDPTYLAGAGHRKAALEDSRLLPINEASIAG
ncbi:MAG: DUF1330 domain-containing protein [Flavobacteriaceae bacterium]|nr:MAG: DUF1330 domain-containing protein [Flavobacteriaceae bacterium]